MCGTCGCSSGAVVTLLAPGQNGRRVHGLGQAGHEHEHEHEHVHTVHDHGSVAGGGDHRRTVELQQKVLAKNDALAEQNRGWLRERGILAVNLMSSPGAGKTTLLERTTRDLAGYRSR